WWGSTSNSISSGARKSKLRSRRITEDRWSKSPPRVSAFESRILPARESMAIVQICVPRHSRRCAPANAGFIKCGAQGNRLSVIA
ncbi:hypothetical protein QMO17_37415, partial [Klebsiella pneumoniae]|nr:hypothetical protein [Klebsiella pneumoniae]